MLINHKYKFIFLKPSRVGGSSLQRALLQDFGEAEVGVIGDHLIPSELRGLNYKPIMLHSHAEYSEILTHFPEVEDYVLLSCKRNPYERFISTINFYKSIRKKAFSGASLTDFEYFYDHALLTMQHDRYLTELQKPIIFLEYAQLQKDYKAFCRSYMKRASILPHLKNSENGYIEFPEELRDKFNKDMAYEFSFYGYEMK